MSERVFEYIDGKSRKFWAIAVSGAAHTVRFGRLGTAGQSKTKTFPSEEAARRDADTLVAEKTGKGYKEVTVASGGREPPDAGGGGRTGGASGGSRPPLATEPRLAVTRSIDLEPTDHLWVTYRPRPAIPQPAAEPFDLKRCLEEFGRVYERWGTWWFERARVPEHPSPEEGQFWFAAADALRGGKSHSVARVKLARLAYDGTVPDDALSHVQTGQDKLTHVDHVLSRAARAVVTPERFLELAADPDFWNRVPWWAPPIWEVPEHFRRFVLPAMTDEQLARLRDLLRPLVSVRHWPVATGRVPASFGVAAACGLHREMEALVHTWPDGLGATPDGRLFQWEYQQVVFGLGSREKVEHHFRRLGLTLSGPPLVRAWLAHTGFSALDVARDGVLAATRKDDAEALTKELCRVNAPEAAPVMLELRLDSKAPTPARDWLTANVGNAVAGLIPVAVGNGKLAKAAVEYLREVKRKGHDRPFDEALKTATPELAAFIRWTVLEHKEKVYPEAAESALPEELRTQLAVVSSRRPALPPWVGGATLPPILVGGARLSEAQVLAVVYALKTAPGGPVPRTVTALRRHADPHSLDAFAWHLFELWVREGLPTRDRWAFAALGLLGGDNSALKLTPFIREWPGMGKHRQAVTGLEVLRAIGTDTALMQLHGVAQKARYQAIKAKAREMMDAVAADRGLTRAELEDRIVPDLGLDEHGGRTFDFGPRQFRVALAADLTPVTRDAEGKVRADLPKPGVRDDPDKAEAAVAEWKLLKKQLREALRLQGPRLEQAMVTQRRWPVAQFEALLVRHPLMTNLARRLVWGGYHESGALLRTFRVTEEKDYAGPDDKPVSLEGVATVGLVHPLHLDEPTRGAWGQLMGEYELIPPFPQLARPVYRLNPGEERQRGITRFADARLPSLAVWGGMEKLGWTRGSSSNHGVVTEFSKPFPSAGVTAVIEIQPGIPRGGLDALGEDQRITGCFFLNRLYAPEVYPYHREEHRRPLGEVDPVAVSEVLADLAALAAKGV